VPNGSDHFERRSNPDYSGALGRVKAPLAGARRCRGLDPPSALPMFFATIEATPKCDLIRRSSAVILRHLGLLSGRRSGENGASPVVRIDVGVGRRLLADRVSQRARRSLATSTPLRWKRRKLRCCDAVTGVTTASAFTAFVAQTSAVPTCLQQRDPAARFHTVRRRTPRALPRATPIRSSGC
jgi:hypothetical protein